MNANVTNATRFTNDQGTYYTGIVKIEEPVEVRGVSVIKTADGYIALPPQRTTKDGKYKTVITWDRTKAAELVTAAVEADKISKLNSEVTTSLGTKIGYARIEIPCNVSVTVNVAEDGTAYLNLPGRPYTVKGENDEDVKKMEYFVFLDKETRDALAKEIVDTAKDYEPKAE